MARYEHLPIYKAALDVAVGFEKLVAGFSRYHKYTLWAELRNGSRRVLEQESLQKTGLGPESRILILYSGPAQL